MLLSASSLWARLDRNATVLRIRGSVIHRAKKTLATAAISGDIVAVRHDLPHMPSLGVSSLDSRPPWRHGGLLFSAVPLHFPICAPRSLPLRCSIHRRLSAPHSVHSAARRPASGLPPSSSASAFAAANRSCCNAGHRSVRTILRSSRYSARAISI